MNKTKTQYQVGDTKVRFDPDGFDTTLPARGGKPERTIRFTCSWGYKAPSGNWNHCGAPATWNYAKTIHIGNLEDIGIAGFTHHEHRCSQHPMDVGGST